MNGQQERDSPPASKYYPDMYFKRLKKKKKQKNIGQDS
jgi:hypothetical protein